MKSKITLYTLLISIQFVIINTVTIAQNSKEIAPPTTINFVDLQKYAGLWYEVAKIPNSFQDQCAYGTTAEYKIEPNGDIIVINKCYDIDGKLDIADGVAEVVDKNTNSKLEVSFVSFLGIRPFWGDYWIIGLGENYEYAIVGHPERKYGWILSRTPTLSDETMKVIYETLSKQGYNINQFELTDQTIR